MTQDEIIEMVNQAGCVSYSPPPLRAVAGASMTFAQLDALIKLVAAKEREACAELCWSQRKYWDAEACADAIRARSNSRGEA